MSQIHEERKDFYSNRREGVLTSSPNIRSIVNTSQNMEKEKSEKPLFGQPAYGMYFQWYNFREFLLAFQLLYIAFEQETLFTIVS
jgi:hypothetical protein